VTQPRGKEARFSSFLAAGPLSAAGARGAREPPTKRILASTTFLLGRSWSCRRTTFSQETKPQRPRSASAALGRARRGRAPYSTLRFYRLLASRGAPPRPVLFQLTLPARAAVPPFCALGDILTNHGGSVKRPDEEERSLLRAVARAAQDRTKAQQRLRNAHALAPNTGKHLRHEEGLG